MRTVTVARRDAATSPGHVRERTTLAIRSDGNSECRIKETAGTMVLSNGMIECTFDKERGGVLSDIKDLKNPSIIFHTPDEALAGEWSIDLLSDGAIASSGTKYVRGEYTSGNGKGALKLYCDTQGGKLAQSTRSKTTEEI